MREFLAAEQARSSPDSNTATLPTPGAEGKQWRLSFSDPAADRTPTEPPSWLQRAGALFSPGNADAATENPDIPTLPPGFRAVAPATPLPQGFRASGAPTPSEPQQPPVSGSQEYQPFQIPYGEIAGRGLYGGAKGAVSGTLGLVPDLVNLATLLATYPFREGDAPRIPAGSHDIQGWIDKAAGILGYQPPTPGSMGEHAEQGATALGTFVGPGGALRLATRLGVPLEVLTRLVSAGPVRDAALGITGAVGGEVARDIFPGYANAPAIGAIAAPLALAGLHGLADASLRATGRRVLPRQEVGRAGEALATAQDTLSQTRAQAETANRAITERYRLLQEGEKSRLRPLEAQQEAADAASLAAQGNLASTTERAAEQTSMQVGLVQDAADNFLRQHGVTQIRQQGQLQHLDQLLPPGPGLAPLPAGRAIQAETAQGVESARELLAQGYRQLENDVGPRLSRMQVAERAKAWGARIFDTWRDTKNVLFEATEKVTGDTPIVALTTLKQRIAPMLDESAQTGQPVPRGTRQMGQTATADISAGDLARAQAAAFPGMTQAMSMDELRDLSQYILRGGLAGVTPQRRQVLEQFLQQLSSGGDALVPFWLARRMESALGEMAYKGARPIGTLQQGRARQLYWSIQDDLRRFYTDLPEGQVIAPELRKAKDFFIDGIQTYNKSIIGGLLDNAPGKVEQFLDKFLGTKSNEQLLRVRENADPATWQMFSAYALSDLFERASPGGVFDPSRFRTISQRITNYGKIDVLLTPDQKARFMQLTQEMGDFKHSDVVKMHQVLASKTPEDILGYVFQPGVGSHTLAYHGMTSPSQFDEAVKAWAGKFLRDSADLSPDQLYKRLEPMARDMGTGQSQLDTMLAQYPGTADAITDRLAQYRSGGQVVATLADLQQQAQAAVKTTQEMGKAREDIVRLAGTRTVEQAYRDAAQAQAAVDRATRQLELLESRGARLKRVTEAGGHQRIVEAQEEVRNAQGLLRDAKVRAGLPETFDLRHFSRLGTTGMYVRSGAVLGGITALIEGLLTGHPVTAIAGGTIAGGAMAFNAFTHSAPGQRLMASGLKGQYGLAAVRFATQVLAGELSTPPGGEFTPPSFPSAP